MAILGPQGEIILHSFGLACITALMIFRFFAQLRYQKPWGVTYWVYEILIWLAFGCNCYIQAFNIWACVNERRLGAHPSPEQLKGLIDGYYLKIFWAGGLLYTFFLWLAKASFVTIYYHVLRPMSGSIRKVLHGVAAFVAVTFVINIFMKFLWCHPVPRNWSTGKDRCSGTQAFPVNSTTSFFNMSTDIALLMLFILIMRSVRELRHRDLIAATFVAFVGTCTVVAAAIRYAVVFQSFKDGSWRSMRKQLLWTCVEVGLVMLALTLPAFRVFLRREPRGSARTPPAHHTLRHVRMFHKYKGETELSNFDTTYTLQEDEIHLRGISEEEELARPESCVQRVGS